MGRKLSPAATLWGESSAAPKEPPRASGSQPAACGYNGVGTTSSQSRGTRSFRTWTRRSTRAAPWHVATPTCSGLALVLSGLVFMASAVLSLVHMLIQNGKQTLHAEARSPWSSPATSPTTCGARSPAGRLRSSACARRQYNKGDGENYGFDKDAAKRLRHGFEGSAWHRIDKEIGTGNTVHALEDIMPRACKGKLRSTSRPTATAAGGAAI